MLRAVVASRNRAGRLSARRWLSVAADDKPVAPTEGSTPAAEGAPQMVSDIPMPKKMKPQDRPKKLPWYYAVRKGREVGVFKDWEEAKGKVLGCSGAVFKPFRDEQRARKWLERDLSEIDPKDLPMPKKKSEELEVKASKYVLNFGTVLSTSEDPAKQGMVGMGWILRKFPERTLVVAGCDLYNMQNWKKNHPKRPGYAPRLPRELPMLEALNRALDDVKRVFKLDESTVTPPKEGENAKPSKLPFPLQIRSDHVYTIGLISGANPTIPELVAPLKDAQTKIRQVAAAFDTEEIPSSVNNIAQGLAKAALARKFARCTIEGGSFVASYENLLDLINKTPDVPSGVNPVAPPPAKPMEINGTVVSSYNRETKTAKA